MLGLGPVRVAREPALLAQLGKTVASAGEQLVDVGLVAGVEHDRVLRGVEDPMQGDGQLDDTKVGPKMSARLGDRVDQERPDLFGQQRHLVRRHSLEVLRTIDRFQQLHARGLPSY